MTAFDTLTWQEAMRHGHAALVESERLYQDINAAEGRSNLDIENTSDEPKSKPPKPKSGSP
jgi:hypothetical protein